MMSPEEQSEAAGRGLPSGNDAELILVVEDDEALLRLIEHCLGALGYRTRCAADGASALGCVEQNPPRLILLDYSLPDMRGEQLLERLAAAGRSVPFVVATGHGSESVAVEMMKRGALDYLVKNASFLELLPAVVEQALERVRQAERLVEAEEQLRRAHEELENRVRLRTAELAEANRRLLIEMDERRRAVEQLHQHQAEFAHFARLNTLGEMVAELAHELNQPLSAICSHAQACKRLLQDGGDELRAGEFSASLHQVSEQADRAAEIIRRLRRFVAKAKPSQTTIDLNAMIRDVAALTNLEARAAQAEVVFQLLENPPPIVGDRIQLEQVLVNLFRNGFEAMCDCGNQRPRLIVRTALGGANDIVVDVEDNGVGISPDAVERVFDRFYTTKSDGMGMGLPISQSIVENHSGRLWVSQGPGRGASFHFTLPIDTGENSRAN
ncbi:MAG: response regulator [Pirellulaceae bacterium]|nr:response regulator [Pirellulaceae bacterium]